MITKLIKINIGQLIGCAAAAVSLASAQDSQSPPNGYFPTYEETGNGRYIMDQDQYRSNGGPLGPDDRVRWQHGGEIWPYEIETGPVSQMHKATNWMDYVFRPLTPGETTVIAEPTSDSQFQLGAALPFLSRYVHAEQTSFAKIFGAKATQYSPIYFDVLNLSTTALYSSVSGQGSDGVPDGFISGSSLDFRGIFRLTHNSSIILNGAVHLIYGENAGSNVGFYLSGGAPGAFANFRIQEEIGEWDVQIYDDFAPYTAQLVLQQETANGAVDVSGNSYIGIFDDINGGSWWDPENLTLTNTAGFTAGRFLGENFRLLTAFARIDNWLLDGGESRNYNTPENHIGREYTSVSLFYDEYDWWIAPSFTYMLATEDFGNPQHFFSLNGTVPISDNIQAQAGIGWSVGNDYDGYTAHLGLSYQQNERLGHTLYYAHGYSGNRTGALVTYGDTFGYGLSYKWGPRTTLGYTAGWATDGKTGSNSIINGISMNVALGNYTALNGFVGYQDFSRTQNNTYLAGANLLYRLSLSRKLISRLDGAITAQYTQRTNKGIKNGTTGDFGYDELMLSLTLTRTF